MKKKITLKVMPDPLGDIHNGKFKELFFCELSMKHPPGLVETPNIGIGETIERAIHNSLLLNLGCLTGKLLEEGEVSIELTKSLMFNV